MNLWLFAAFVLVYIGLGLLALSQKRHWQKCARGLAPVPSRGLRLACACLLLIAFSLLLVSEGLSFGLVLFLLTLIVNCLLVTLAANLAPQWFCLPFNTLMIVGRFRYPTIVRSISS